MMRQTFNKKMMKETLKYPSMKDDETDSKLKYPSTQKGKKTVMHHFFM